MDAAATRHPAPRSAGSMRLRSGNRPAEPGGLPGALADVGDLVPQFGYRSVQSTREGVARFVHWCRDLHEKHDLSGRVG
jgi:hypothetical protein